MRKRCIEDNIMEATFIENVYLSSVLQITHLPELSCLKEMFDRSVKSVVYIPPKEGNFSEFKVDFPKDKLLLILPRPAERRNI